MKNSFKKYIQITNIAFDLNVQIMVPEGQGGGHKRENYIYIGILERIF
jgi:hypothetical protein